MAVAICDEYRKAARRLRHRLRGQPARLQRALRKLSERANEQADVSSAMRKRAEAPHPPLSPEYRGEGMYDYRCEGTRRRPSDGERGEDTPGHPSEGRQRFAAAVIASMDGPVLRYSERRRLIGSAESVGIGRFEANLIIAAIQHRGRTVPAQTSSPARMSRFRWMPAVCVAIVIQSAIALAVWSILGT